MHMIYRSWHPGTHSHPEEMADTGTWDEGWPVRGHYAVHDRAGTEGKWHSPDVEWPGAVSVHQNIFRDSAERRKEVI